MSVTFREQSTANTTIIFTTGIFLLFIKGMPLQNSHYVEEMEGHLELSSSLLHLALVLC